MGLPLNYQAAAPQLLCQSALASTLSIVRASGDGVATITDNLDPAFIRPSGFPSSLKIQVTTPGTLDTVYNIDWAINKTLHDVARFALAYHFSPSTTVGWGWTMYIGQTSTYADNLQYGPLTVIPNSARHGWNTISLDRQTTSTVGGAPVLTTPFQRVRFRLQFNAGVTGTIYIGPLLYNQHNRPKVIFTFDDQAWASQYSSGFVYMRDRAVVGSHAVETSIVKAGNGVTLPNLLEMNALGWSFHNHTHTHPDLTTLDEAGLISEIGTAQDYLNQWGLTNGRDTFVYPFGATNDFVESVLQRFGYRQGAIVRAQIEKHWDGLESPFRINRQDTGGNVLATLTTRIDQAVKWGGYAAFLTHDIAVGATGAQTELSVFQGLVNYALRLRDANVLDIITLQEFIDGLAGFRPRRF